MGILFGLLAALGWGSGDFLISRVSRAIGAIQTMFYVQLAGIFTIGLVLLARRDLPPTDPAIWLLALWVNVFNLGGTLLLYRAFVIGSLAVVSPIAAGFSVVTVLLAMLSGERVGLVALLGTAIVIGGVLVVSRGQGGAGFSPRGVPEALGAALCLGIFFWMIGWVTPTMGVAWPIMIGRVLALLTALAVLLPRGQRPARLGRDLWPAVLGATILDTTAFLSYNIGIATAYVSVVTALASIFSAVTVLLAWALLRERLARSQWAGVGAILLGVLLVSM